MKEIIARAKYIKFTILPKLNAELEKIRRAPPASTLGTSFPHKMNQIKRYESEFERLMGEGGSMEVRYEALYDLLDSHDDSKRNEIYKIHQTYPYTSLMGGKRRTRRSSRRSSKRL